jgi:hypothetical protein
VKSFYTVLYMPSAVRIEPMRSRHPRWHHRVAWKNCVPKILKEAVKKKERSEVS